MKNKLLLIFFLSLGWTSCKTQYSKIELRANFTSREIADLNKITSFFKEEVCGNMDFDTCFRKINIDSLVAEGENVWNRISFEKQVEFYSEISTSVFDEIWMFCESTYHPSGIKAKEICSAVDGKYLQYLKDLGRNNPRIAEYAKRIRASGDFNVFDVYFKDLLQDNEYFNLNDSNIQLILAVHYLTMNDQEKRNASLKEMNSDLLKNHNSK